MAGPGGGPPRRSHTKSRKGCETCKRRHIRCDENFPQCRNCTKHKHRCPYNDMSVQDDRSCTPDKADLMWTPDIEAAIDHWRLTGLFPFPGLNVVPQPNPQSLTLEDMRLVHHVASISDQLATLDANNFTIWTRQIPTILKIGATHDYVMHALLAFSASHIGFMTDCPLVGNMAYEHRGKALKGLQEAISIFDRETSDAVLAASLVLSWQDSEWKSWTQLMQGTSTVIDAMQPWKHESQFGDFIAESSTFPTAPPSPRPSHRPSQPCEEDLDALQRTFQQLHKVEQHLKQSSGDTKSITQLASFLKGARKVSPNMPISERFERLHPLRRWLFWLPVGYLQQTGGSPNALVIIAHYYTVALLMERLFPEIGAAYFASMTITPVEEIARRLYSINLDVGNQDRLQIPAGMMEFPMDIVNEFRSRMGWSQPERAHSMPQFDYGSEAHSPLSMPPATKAEYLTFGANPAFSYSTEDMSLATSDSAPNSAIGSLQLSSPFANAHYYLGISSPSYGGYSPESSTFGDLDNRSSIAFSDHTDFEYDMAHNVSTSAPGMDCANTCANTYGVGFVPPFHTVWIQRPQVPQRLAKRGEERLTTRAPRTPCLTFSKMASYSPPQEACAGNFLFPGPSPSSYLDVEHAVAIMQLPPSPAPEHTFHPGHRYKLSTASAPPTVPDR